MGETIAPELDRLAAAVAGGTMVALFGARPATRAARVSTSGEQPNDRAWRPAAPLGCR